MNRAVLGFEAIYQQEGLQLSEEQVQAEYESGVQVRRMMPAWTLSKHACFRTVMSVRQSISHQARLHSDAPIKCSMLTPTSTRVRQRMRTRTCRGAQAFKESGQEFDAKRLREQAVEAVRVRSCLAQSVRCHLTAVLRQVILQRIPSHLCGGAVESLHACGGTGWCDASSERALSRWHLLRLTGADGIYSASLQGMKVLEFLQSTCTINIKPYVGS